MMSITELEIRVYIRNTILSEIESYAYTDFPIRNRFRYMLIFILKFMFRFCIRSYVVHPLAIKSGRSEDHNR
ncbi:hypothetical protein LOK49_LG09G00694 [Camellia lanceoleosa]|uniref:Uncharacterized protein n=1 Tax=Camellia lanceoleosa TaxID=1840588 RepID=A0ACC0GI11_9ERIC|nr:hypothetical protein LOK49_LG09G00694 [Camellia lanceoleosa]